MITLLAKYVGKNWRINGNNSQRGITWYRSKTVRLPQNPLEWSSSRFSAPSPRQPVTTPQHSLRIIINLNKGTTQEQQKKYQCMKLSFQACWEVLSKSCSCLFRQAGSSSSVGQLLWGPHVQLRCKVVITQSVLNGLWKAFLWLSKLLLAPPFWQLQRIKQTLRYCLNKVCSFSLLVKQHIVSRMREVTMCINVTWSMKRAEMHTDFACCFNRRRLDCAAATARER